MDGNIYNNFGYLLKKAREELPLSQSELATKTGINRVTIARIENGKQRIFLDTALKLTSAVHLDISEVLKMIQSATPEKEIESKVESETNKKILKGLLEDERKSNA